MSHYSIIDQVDIGAAALSRGDNEKARESFCIAARELLVQAKKNQDPLRQQQIQQANKLLKQVQNLQPSSSLQEGSSLGDISGVNDSFLTEEVDTALSLDDVAGLESVKQAFKAKFLYPLKDPVNAKKYKQSGAGGMLLYGPPGTGKTFLVRALASELGAPVFVIKPSEIMDKYVGGSEQNLAALFDEARQHPLALVFIDEIDALAPSRTDNNDSVSQRLVPQLLAELDGFTANDNKLLFLGATNEPWSLDKAIMRPGRFDELCYVDLPSTGARTQILTQHLEGVPLQSSLNISNISDLTEGYSGADLFGLCMKATQAPYIELMETGVARDVALNDFETAILGMPRSINQEMLDRYQNFSNLR